jgi:alanine-synthesizing transaminase
VRDIVLLAQEAARSGKQMLYLNIGDPNQFDFVTPPHILNAIQRALFLNQNGYSPSSGIKPALAAIEREAHRKGIDNVLDLFVTTGASEGIEICLSALADSGENVLIPMPGYPLYSAILSKLGVIENPYYLDEANEWQPSLEDIASKITPKTRAIVLINPNNPTGSVCSEETLRGVIDLALRHNLVIFADHLQRFVEILPCTRLPDRMGHRQRPRTRPDILPRSHQQDSSRTAVRQPSHPIRHPAGAGGRPISSDRGQCQAHAAARYHRG